MPPGAHTLFITSVLTCRGISFFSPDEDSCINRRNVGKFSTCFYVFSASRAWLNLFRWYFAWSGILLVMAFMSAFWQCASVRVKAYCFYWVSAVMAHSSQYFVPGTPVRQWQGRGCCEERQESAQTHLTWQLWPVLGFAWNAQYPPPRCQSQLFRNCVWPFYTFGIPSDFEALEVCKRLTRPRQTKQCYDSHAKSLSTLHANRPVLFSTNP